MIVPICSTLRILCSFLDMTVNEGHRKKNLAYLLEIATAVNDLELVSQEDLGSQGYRGSDLSFIKLVL